MPLFELSTNTPLDNCQLFAERASKMTAEMLGKPESYVMVKVLTEQTLIFAGTGEPAAHVKLKSLGLPENNTADFCSRICAFINTELNISSSRIYIEFSSPDRHMWGWDKRTF
ncbi:MAG: phenylpyruvate tautomerase MIF-related protein [Gammaproteobacteria bacterium]|jgi:phenylpyruvate tautomerase PptA (4-oxalocrotonate tautomerase family)|nr:phenylpyruvate tautomerase MIF-related protein [Gammaproteobacteria bacterium]